MDLINSISHKANTKVLVNGHVYHIGHDGILKDVPEADAAEMLQNTAWAVLDPEAAKKRADKVAAGRGGMKLITTAGEQVGQAPAIPPAPKAAVVPVEPQVDEEEDVDDEEGEDEGQESSEAEETSSTPRSKVKASKPPEAGPEEGQAPDEWPDPTPQMAAEYLKQMAEAYEVKVPKGRIDKEKLVKKIMKAMYA